jgi:hypothetical protein
MNSNSRSHWQWLPFDDDDGSRSMTATMDAVRRRLPFDDDNGCRRHRRFAYSKKSPHPEAKNERNFHFDQSGGQIGRSEFSL